MVGWLIDRFGWLGGRFDSWMDGWLNRLDGCLYGFWFDGLMAACLLACFYGWLVGIILAVQN